MRSRAMQFMVGTALAAHYPLAHAVEFIIWGDEDLGPMLPAWPADLRNAFSTSIARWRDDNPQRRVVSMTSAIYDTATKHDRYATTVILHHVAIEPPATPATTGEDHDAD